MSTGVEQEYLYEADNQSINHSFSITDLICIKLIIICFHFHYRSTGNAYNIILYNEYVHLLLQIKWGKLFLFLYSFRYAVERPVCQTLEAIRTLSISPLITYVTGSGGLSWNN